ncbi:MAG: hypothetical protein AB7N65_21595 [Vicinamibacterales bacterium]
MGDTELATVAPMGDDAEISAVARRLGDAYAANVRWRMKELQESVEEADRCVRSEDDQERQRRAETEAADTVSWWSLTLLIEADPDAGWAVWERVKAEASDELTSGHRAAEAICWDDSPWQRARFLAIRQAFVHEWLPRGGIELTLIDQMAQAHSLYLEWIERAHMQASLEGARQQREIGERGRWQARTLGTAETLDQSAQMAERWQKLFVRALRALRDLRRHAPPVVLAGPGSQVNVGHQQINTTGALGEVHPISGGRAGGQQGDDEVIR